MVCDELSKLETWVVLNKLSLNVSKTNYMILNNFEINHDIQLFIGRNLIKQVSETTFLLKLYKEYVIVKRTSHVLSKYSLNMLYVFNVHIKLKVVKFYLLWS